MDSTYLPLFICGIALFVIVMLTHIATTIREEKQNFKSDCEKIHYSVLVELYRMKYRHPEATNELDNLIELWEDKKG